MLLLIIFSVFLNFALSCAPNQFQCGDNTCITQNFRCDNFEDCKDGSDEIGCKTTGCSPYEFRCSDGMCITNEFRCDQFRDCKDGSDEVGCYTVQKPDCSEGCSDPIFLYEDLNCKPKRFSRGNCCPTAFDCSHIEARANLVEEKCYFNDRTYNLGETINDSEIYGACYSNCTCRKTASMRLTFDCNLVKCPEWSFDNYRPGCHLKYEPGKCCSTGKVCEPFHGSCRVGDKIYFEGQRFDSPTEKCAFCVCKANALDQTQSSFCSKYQCMQEIRFYREVINFCAPSYLTLDDCCPINWICPQNDKIIISKALRRSKSKCRYGNLQLNVGDKFKRLHKPSGGKVVCECKIPPYLTCIQDYKFPTIAV